LNIQIRPLRVLVALVSLIGFLTLANIAVLVLKIVFDHDHVFGLVSMFDFNSEMNVPTFYSSLIIVLASILLAIIGMYRRRDNSAYKAWFGLAFIFLFLAVDEFASIHEGLMEPAGTLMDASGFLFHVWIVPYAIALLVFVGSYIKFLLTLPRTIMWLFIGSGALFVAGALGMESLGGRHLELYGPDGYYYFMTTCEELLEMVGIALFVYTLLSYIAAETPGIRLSVGGS